MSRKKFDPFNSRKYYYGRDGIRKNIPDRELIRAGREILSSMSGKKLNEKLTPNERRKLRKNLDEFFDATTGIKTKMIRPRKNKKAYSDATGLSMDFKVFPVGVMSDRDKIKLSRNKKRIKTSGEFISTDFFPFEDRKAFAKSPVAATKKVLKEIQRHYKNVPKEIRIKVGNNTTNLSFSDELAVTREMQAWVNQYGSTKMNLFVAGLQVETFKNQKQYFKNHPKNKRAAPRIKKTAKSHKGKR